MTEEQYIAACERMSPIAEAVSDREAGVRFSKKRFKNQSVWAEFKTRVYLDKMDDLIEAKGLLR
jgi:hypothetical protein